MRAMLAVCLVALLAVATGADDQCVKKTRTPGAKNPVDDNLECIENNNCEDGNDEGAQDDECDCVPYYLCDNDTIIDNGKGLIDIRINGASECSDTMEVCCGKPEQISPNTGGTGPNGGKQLSYAPTPNRSCGQRNKDGVGFRITGNSDNEAQFGEFPWMVALITVENGKQKFAGGGSLVHPQVVLTAAHSVLRFKTDPSSLRVRAGEWDTQSESEIVPYQQLQVKEVIVHEQYNKGSLYNDIALLVLHEQFDQADNLGTLCLPTQGAVVDSTECIATGWGKDVFGKEGCYQVILKSILLPIVQPSVCEPLLRKTRLGRKFRLHTSFTCAGGEEGKDACMGDGGGPLACPIPGDDEFYEQGGIISWGIGCGDEDVPGVYTNVALFRDWVDDKFTERGLESEAYQRP